MKILNFGSLNIDYVYRVERFALAVSRMGAAPSIPTEEEVALFLRDRKKGYRGGRARLLFLFGTVKSDWTNRLKGSEVFDKLSLWVMI